MKKLALSLSMIVFLALGTTVFAQDVKPEAKKAEPKNEMKDGKKSCCADKKSCTPEEKKACTDETKTPEKK